MHIDFIGLFFSFIESDNNLKIMNIKIPLWLVDEFFSILHLL